LYKVDSGATLHQEGSQQEKAGEMCILQ